MLRLILLCLVLSGCGLSQKAREDAIVRRCAAMGVTQSHPQFFQCHLMVEQLQMQENQANQAAANAYLSQPTVYVVPPPPQPRR